MEDLIKKIRNLPGFKIEDSHFRIGSKVHISHFYYAKRFFQNSFFASRVAFLIAKHITKEYANKIPDFKINGLTLIGYGLYSELLLSLTVQYLRNQFKLEEVSSGKISHNLINDAENLKLIKEYEPIEHKNILIIVPIATTFSTSIKIEQQLRKSGKLPENVQFLEPYINVIYSFHGEIKNLQSKIELLQKFGISSHDKNNEVVIESIQSGSQTLKKTKQKFFLGLPTEWHQIEECKMCFPDHIPGLELTGEKPLYITDNTLVTPSLIFDTPFTYDFAKRPYGTDVIFTSDMLNYGHYKRDNVHYHYYIRTEVFYKRNESRIKAWLKELKLELIRSKTYQLTDHVKIAAPGHYANTGFVNLVNEILFSNAANIIHFDLENENIQNFLVFYKHEIEREEAKVFFVDDILTTGNTFNKINYFLKYSGPEIKEIAASIFLLDRSGYFAHKGIIEKIKDNNHFAFCKIHLPSIKGFDLGCPMCQERKRYIKLTKISFLDRTRWYFFRQMEKLNPIRTNQVSYDQNRHIGNRYISRVEAIHRIYVWFSISKTNFKEIDFQEWKQSLLNITSSPFKENRLNIKDDQNYLSDSSKTILKVLTQPPFKHYMLIRDKVFSWIIEILDQKVKVITSKLEKSEFSYNDFNDLKFLTRRAGLLNANYLISSKFFQMMTLLFGENGILSLMKKLNENSLLDKTPLSEEHIEKIKRQQLGINSFMDFYVAQIKELLFLNEARSIHLENILIGLENKKDLPFLNQLVRILRVENGLLYRNFWNVIKYDIQMNKCNPTEEEVSMIVKNNYVNSHHYETLNRFNKISKAERFELSNDDRFIKFLWLKNYLRTERMVENDGTRLSDKTRKIVEVLKDIVSIDEESGAFFIVKYNSNAESNFFAYNKNDVGKIDEKQWYSTKNVFLKEFFNGEKVNTTNNYLKTVIELKYDSVDKKWFDLYYHGIEKRNVKIDPYFLGERFDRLILLRISKMNSSFNHPQGVLGFYHSSDEGPNLESTRYLLMLRSDLSDFIQRHHENDEFRDWKDADYNRRLALLSGHGREMLLNISHKQYIAENGDRDRYKNIVLNLEHVQLILALKENQSTISKKSWKDKFRKFYSIKESSLLNKKYFQSLAQMGADLFLFEEIENKVKISNAEGQAKIQLSEIDDNINFPFNKNILDLLIFELFINAKKNRWHFLKDDKIGEYSCNRVWLNVYERDEQLIIKLSNTGPRVDDETFSKLNNKENPKDNEVGGMALIFALLQEENFDLGNINFKQDWINMNYGFSKFTVQLELKPMK